MGIIEEIGKMRQFGKSDQEIVKTLRQRGISDKEISNLLSQSQIKEAVTSPSQTLSPMQDPPDTSNYQTPYFGMSPTIEELGSMQPSLLNQQQAYQEPIPSTPAPLQEAQYPEEQLYPQESYPETYPQQYLNKLMTITINIRNTHNHQ